MCENNVILHMLQLNHKKFANVFCGWSLLMAFLGSKISLFAFQFFLIFNSLKSSVKILWRSVEKRTKENEWLSMVHLPIYFLEYMSGSLNVSEQIYSFVWVSFLIANSISQSQMIVFVLFLFYLLLKFLNLQGQIGNIFLFLIDFPFLN